MQLKAPAAFITQNLEMRRPELSDVQDIFVYGSDPEVAYYTDWLPLSSKVQLEEMIKRRKVDWETGEEYYWVITERKVGKCIGGISCRVQDAQAEIGYLLNKEYWGRGYAAEAAKMIIAWLQSLHCIKRISATCDCENTASIRVLEKIGMIREKVVKTPSTPEYQSKTKRFLFIFNMLQRRW